MSELQFFRPLAYAFLILAGQIYWATRAYRLIVRPRPNSARSEIFSALLILYVVVIVYNSDRLFQFPSFGPQPNPTRLGFTDALLATIQWWMLTSTVAFVLVIPIAVIREVTGMAGHRLRRRRLQHAGRSQAIATITPPAKGMDRPIAKDGVISRERRQVLEYAATAIVGAPFVAGAYALLYGRLNLEIVRKRIRLPRLPREFAGFRIAQLSDVHISSFMSDSQIRKYAVIANELHADLIVLTGDFLSWDPSAGAAVVNALSGLRAPFKVFACLGNHEAWPNAKDSMTELLEAAGISVLRDRNVPIIVSGERLNLVGIEPEYGWTSMQVPKGFLEPQRVNILMSHYPTVFDHAADLGFDFVMAGHTHGGQVPVHFVGPRVVSSVLRSPYFAGSYERRGSQLYVNRGIGTIGMPMRLGSTPEITLFELLPA